MVYFIPPSQRQTLLFAAQLDQTPVLIQGATGTGKGAIARWIHENSIRMTRPLKTLEKSDSLVNALIDANGSTLVISEINDLASSDQRTLVRFLKTKTIETENDSITRMLTTRVIALTSHRLESRARAGIFSTDLLGHFQKLNIKMPPLSERMDEFEDITLGILREKVRELEKDYISGISVDAWKVLKTYEWPGNLRELRNTLHMAVSRAQDAIITPVDLPEIERSDLMLLGGRKEFEKIFYLEILKMFDNDIEASAEMARVTPEALLEKLREHQIELPQAPT